MILPHLHFHSTSNWFSQALSWKALALVNFSSKLSLFSLLCNFKSSIVSNQNEPFAKNTIFQVTMLVWDIIFNLSIDVNKCNSYDVTCQIILLQFLVIISFSNGWLICTTWISHQIWFSLLQIGFFFFLIDNDLRRNNSLPEQRTNIRFRFFLI